MHKWLCGWASRVEPCRAVVDHYFITQKEVPHLEKCTPKSQILSEEHHKQTNKRWILGGSSPESHWICPSFWGLDSGPLLPKVLKKAGEGKKNKKIGGKSGGQNRSFWTCLIFPWFGLGFYIIIWSSFTALGHKVMDTTTTEVAFSDPHGILFYFILKILA